MSRWCAISHMDPLPLVTPERSTIIGWLRLAGPVLAIMGFASAASGWDGRPSDTLVRVSVLFGLPTPWIDDVRAWIDGPVRHDTLVVIAMFVTVAIVICFGWMAGDYISLELTKRDLVLEGDEDEIENADRFFLSRVIGTGTSFWLGIAVLMELRAFGQSHVVWVALGAGAAMVLVAFLKRFRDRNSTGATKGGLVRETLTSLSHSVILFFGLTPIPFS